MKRALEKRKRAAASEAQRALDELEGKRGEEPQAIGGRRNFGLQGGIQVRMQLFIPSMTNVTDGIPSMTNVTDGSASIQC